MLPLSWLNPPPHPITVYASHPPSPTTAQHSLPGGALPPYRGRSFTGRNASASPDAPELEVRIHSPPAESPLRTSGLLAASRNRAGSQRPLKRPGRRTAAAAGAGCGAPRPRDLGAGWPAISISGRSSCCRRTGARCGVVCERREERRLLQLRAHVGADERRLRVRMAGRPHEASCPAEMIRVDPIHNLSTYRGSRARHPPRIEAFRCDDHSPVPGAACRDI